MADRGSPAPEVEIVELRAGIAAAGDDPDALRLLFERLVTRTGADRASQLWWAVFSAADASET